MHRAEAEQLDGEQPEPVGEVSRDEEEKVDARAQAEHARRDRAAVAAVELAPSHPVQVDDDERDVQGDEDGRVRDGRDAAGVVQRDQRDECVRGVGKLFFYCIFFLV